MTAPVGKFVDLLSASYPSDMEEFQISLKSTLLVYIIYPELLNQEGKSLTDVMPYYNSEHDFYDFTTDLVLDDNTLSCKPLLKTLAGVLDTSLHLALVGDVPSKAKKLPKLSIKVDITGIPSELGIIDLEGSTSSAVNVDTSNIFTLKLMQNISRNPDLDATTIHNLKLVDIITRITNTSEV